MSSLGVSLLIVIAAVVVTRSARKRPGPLQAIVEAALDAMHAAVADVLPEHADLVFPFIATLWLFVGVSNMVGLLPGLRSPTGMLSLTAALALIVFLSVHWFGIRAEGARRYLALPAAESGVDCRFTWSASSSRTLALAIRLFGNMMSLELAALLVLLASRGCSCPVPLLLLHSLEAAWSGLHFRHARARLRRGQHPDARAAPPRRIVHRRSSVMTPMSLFVTVSTVVAVLGIVLGTMLPAIAMGRAIVQALESLARQPEAEK